MRGFEHTMYLFQVDQRSPRYLAVPNPQEGAGSSHGANFFVPSTRESGVRQL